MNEESLTLKMKSSHILSQEEFNWDWRIENFDKNEKGYEQMFSLADDKIIMILNILRKRQNGFYKFEPTWRFKSIDPSYQNKAFELVVNAKDNREKVFYGTRKFQLMETKKQYYVDSSYCFNDKSVYFLLDKDKSLTLLLSMIIRDADEAGYQKNFDHLYLDKNYFSDQLQNNLTMKNFCDFEVTVDDENISAHKVILGTHLDDNQVHELENIKGFSKEAIKSFIMFFYTYNVDNIGYNRILELLVLADKFLVVDLKAKCDEALACCLNDSNDSDIFQAVHQFKLSDKLKWSAFKRIQKKFLKINQELSSDFIDNPEHVKDLVEACQFLLNNLKKTKIDA